MFPQKATERFNVTKFSNKHLASGGCIGNAPGWNFFPSLRETSVLLSFNLSFDLHIHDVSNALFQLVGV